MASNDETAMFMQTMVDSSLRPSWRLTHVPFKTRGGSCPNKEMLKMKEPPGIYMKTKGHVKLKTEPPGILMKTHELIDNRD
jgi:hypothetical protein